MGWKRTENGQLRMKSAHNAELAMRKYCSVTGYSMELLCGYAPEYIAALLHCVVGLTFRPKPVRQAREKLLKNAGKCLKTQI